MEGEEDKSKQGEEVQSVSGKKRTRRGAFCEVPSCNKRPSFGDNLKRYRWCAEHKTPDAKSFQACICEFEGCSKTASYVNEPGGKKRWCTQHKPKGAFLKSALHCQIDGCRKQATFGFPGQQRQWCVQHKMPGAVNLTKRNCNETGCGTKATLVHIETKQRFCVHHAPDLCVEIQSRKKKGTNELNDQLRYVERQNANLRIENRLIRELVDTERLKAFDKDKKRLIAECKDRLFGSDKGLQDVIAWSTFLTESRSWQTSQETPLESSTSSSSQDQSTQEQAEELYHDLVSEAHHHLHLAHPLDHLQSSHQQQMDRQHQDQQQQQQHLYYQL